VADSPFPSVKNGHGWPSYKWQDGLGCFFFQVLKMGTVGLLTNGKMGTVASFSKCQKWARLAFLQMARWARLLLFPSVKNGHGWEMMQMIIETNVLCDH